MAGQLFTAGTSLMSKTMTIYRCGDINDQPLSGLALERTLAVDAVRPAGHLARAQAVFCSPSLTGVARWTYQKMHLAYQSRYTVRAPDPLPPTYAVQIDPEGINAYLVNRWGDVCHDHRSGQPLRCAQYWSSARAVQDLPADLAPQDWEVLVPASAILSMTEVSLEEVCAAADPAHRTTSWLINIVQELEPA